MFMDVSLTLKDAIEKIEKKKENKEMIKRYDGYLSSAYSTFTKSLTEWFVSYYSVEKGEVLVFKTDKSGAVFDSFSKIQKNGPGGHIALEKVKVSAKEALDIALEKNKTEYTKILIALENVKKCEWVVNFFTKELDLFSVKIDAGNGKVLKEKTCSLIIGYGK